MFFILSKILFFLLSPLNIVVLLIGGGILIRKYRKRLLLTALVIGLVFSNPLLLRFTIKWWEAVPQELPVNDSRVRQLVVLGGMSAFHEASGRVRFWQSGDRLMQALLVMQQNPVERLVISGGSASIVLNKRGEGAFLSEFLIGIGVDEELVHIDSLSRNTYENAVYTLEMFEENQWDKEIVLITSAWHMPRARRVFEKQGFEVILIGADPFYPFNPLTPRDLIMPNPGVMATWELLFKEWVGIVAYRLKGYL